MSNNQDMQPPKMQHGQPQPSTMKQGELLRQLVRRKAGLEDERRSYLTHWQELSDVILPRRGR